MLEVPVPDQAGGPGIDVLAVWQSWRHWFDTRLHNLDVPWTHQAGAIPFHQEAGFRVDLLLGWYSKVSVTVSCCPTETGRLFQLLVHLLANRASRPCPVINVDARLEFFSPVANCKVALGPLGIYGLKICLMASQPTLVTQHTAPWIEGPVMSKSRLMCSCLYPASNLSSPPPPPRVGDLPR